MTVVAAGFPVVMAAKPIKPAAMRKGRRRQPEDQGNCQHYARHVDRLLVCRAFHYRSAKMSSPVVE
jgi:hypothetical protein